MVASTLWPKEVATSVRSMADRPHSAISPTSASSSTSTPAMSFLELLTASFLLLVVVASSSDVAAGSNTADDPVVNVTSRHLEVTGTIDYHTAMLNAVNTERAARGLPKLCGNRKLQAAAQTHSTDMARGNYLSHTGSDGSTVSSRVRAAGYLWTVVGENVAAGQATVSRVMASWMSSSDHRANILSTKYNMFGCGYDNSSSSKYDHYWTQDFASGAGEVCG